MGLFKDVGRKVEQFRQAAKDAAAEEASHRCGDCGKRYYTDHDFCPECGGSVEPIEPADEPVEESGAEEESGPEEASADETASEETGATEGAETASETDETGTDEGPTEDADVDADDGSTDE